MLSVIAFPKVTSPLAVNAPVMAVVALFRVTVPVAAPILKVVAAPAKFIVVTVAFKRLKVVAAVTMSPPSTPPTFGSPEPPPPCLLSRKVIIPRANTIDPIARGGVKINPGGGWGVPKHLAVDGGDI